VQQRRHAQQRIVPYIAVVVVSRPAAAHELELDASSTSTMRIFA